MFCHYTDDPDIPMLDVGDFEILDECASDEEEEQKSEYDYEYDEQDVEEDYNEECTENMEHVDNENSNLDENSGDNNDTVLDVSIDVSENEFLETVVEDFSENLEDQTKEENLESQTKQNKNEPVKDKPATELSNADDDLEVIAVVPKKPGPKSKTTNVQFANKKSPIKINFLNKEPTAKISETQKDDEITVLSENQKLICENENTSQNKAQTQKKLQKLPNTQKRKETNDVIQTEDLSIDSSTKEGASSVNNDKEVIEVDNKANEQKVEEEEEDWDKCEVSRTKKPKIKIEERSFKESELWYKEKVSFYFLFVSFTFSRL